MARSPLGPCKRGPLSRWVRGGAATLALMGQFGLAKPSPAEPPPPEQVAVYAVQLNAADVGQWVLLRRESDWYASEEALHAWRIAVDPSLTPLVRHGQRWFALRHLPGYRVREDPMRQDLAIWLAPTVFDDTHLPAEAQPKPALQPVEPALHLNLEVNYTRLQVRQAPVAQELGLYTELGWSNALGVLTSTQIARQPIGGQAHGRDLMGWTRLETTLTQHDPDQRTTLRIGDAITRTGLTGRSVYFGGVQWGTDHGLAPGYSTLPRPTIAGTATTPSTVDLFVNDVLRQTSNVPSGPFSIQTPALFSPDGQLRVVVKDLLGRETVITQPFFHSATQLDEGLQDWSVAVGAVRRRLGLKSNDYGERFAAGLLRQGLTQTLTAELQGHWSGQSQGLGFGTLHSWPSHALALKAGWSLSQQRNRAHGSAWLLGLEWRQGAHSANLQLTRRDPTYLALGDQTGQALSQGLLNYTLTSGNGTSLGLAWARLLPTAQQALTTISATLGQRLAGGAQLLVSASHARGQISATQLTFAFQMPVPGQYAQTLHLARRDRQVDAYLSANGAVNNTTAWRLQAGRQSDQQHLNAGLSSASEKAAWSADLNAAATARALQLRWQGGFMAIGGHVVATRRVDGSFALVEVPGLEGVKVGAFGNHEATTDGSGLALLTNLTPHVSTPIGLDPESVPLGTDIASLEQVAVPRWNSGIKLKFPVRTGRAALVRLISMNGLPIPPGSELTLDDEPLRFIVGARGKAFITGLSSQHRLRVKGEGVNCSAQLTMPAGSPHEVEQIGPLTCMESSP